MRALAARPLGLAAATRGARASAAARVFASWRAPCRGAAGDAGSRAPRGASALSALLRRGFAAGAPASAHRPSAAVRAATPSGFGSAPISPARLAPDGTFPVGADTLVLGIETSCDDTGAAVVTGDGRVLGEALASQVEIHGPWGGVVPNLAREAHESAIDGVVARALADAGVHPSQLSAVAVTVGPGLSMCLRVGVVAAQNLCAAHDVPIVPVHHMEAHALVSRLAGGTDAVRFPFLALLVSGDTISSSSREASAITSSSEAPWTMRSGRRTIRPPGFLVWTWAAGADPRSNDWRARETRVRVRVPRAPA